MCPLNLYIILGNVNVFLEKHQNPSPFNIASQSTLKTGSLLVSQVLLHVVVRLPMHVQPAMS